MTKFLPGQSGNPAGKKPGSVNSSTQLARKVFTENSEALYQKTVEMALNGDIQALKLCLERLVPKIKNETTNFTLPDLNLKKSDSLLIVVEKILQAINNQEITPEQGKLLCDIVESQRKNIEANDLSVRLAEIEYVLKNRRIKKHA